MRVVCPHVGDPHPDTRTVLDRRGNVEYVDLGHDPDYGYALLLRSLWAARESFCLVEQDVVPTLRVLDEFEACPEPYCASPYGWLTTLGPALGCTRFSTLLLRSYPDAMEIACRLPSNYGRAGHWRQLDVRLMQSVLRDLYGLQPHCHAPVQHRNPEKQLMQGATVTSTVDGRSYLPEGLVEQVAAEVAAGRAAAASIPQG